MANRIMKDSGIEWIGEIPESWEVRPIYLIFDEVIRKNYDLETINALKFNFGTIVKKNNFDVSDNYVLNTIKNYTVVDNGNIMINGLNLNYDFVTKRVGMVTEKGAITSAYLAIKLHKDSNCSCKYMTYLLKSYDDCRAFHGMGEGVRKILSFSELKKKLIILPLLSEQKAIADYLDTKCAEIDSLKADITEQIEVLKQYKQSVITEAVTKGLDPDVIMKDSGVEWIGEIPESWEVINPKWYFNQRKDRAKFGMVQYTASQKYGVVTQDEYKRLSGANIVTVQKDFDILKLVCPGDFVIHMRSFQGGLELSTVTGAISSAYVMLIPDKLYVNEKFYKWFFKSSAYIDALSSTSNLIRDGQAMRFANFIKILIVLPPISDQKAIADYLDAKCAEIDKIIEAKGQQLEALEEYKKSMIYEYVTGKKEVPQEV